MSVKAIEHYAHSADPAYGACLQTKSDTVDIVDGAGDTRPCRGIYVGGAGHIRVLMADNTDVLFSNVPAGTFMPIQAKRIFSTNTTATLMIALF